MYQTYILSFLSVVFLALSLLYHRFMLRAKPSRFLALTISYVLISGFLFFGLADFMIAFLKNKGYDVSYSKDYLLFPVMFFFGWVLVALFTVVFTITRRYRREKKGKKT